MNFSGHWEATASTLEALKGSIEKSIEAEGLAATMDALATHFGNAPQQVNEIVPPGHREATARAFEILKSSIEEAISAEGLKSTFDAVDLHVRNAFDQTKKPRDDQRARGLLHATERVANLVNGSDSFPFRIELPKHWKEYTNPENVELILVNKGPLD